MRIDRHGPQDYQSRLMHLEAVRMLKEDPELAIQLLEILARWDASGSVHSKPLRDRWVQIIQEQDWELATDDSVLGNQLRQASPMACILPTEIRLEIIQKVRDMRACAHFAQDSFQITTATVLLQAHNSTNHQHSSKSMCV